MKHNKTPAPSKEKKIFFFSCGVYSRFCQACCEDSVAVQPDGLGVVDEVGYMLKGFLFVSFFFSGPVLLLLVYRERLCLVTAKSLPMLWAVWSIRVMIEWGKPILWRIFRGRRRARSWYVLTPKVVV